MEEKKIEMKTDFGVCVYFLGGIFYCFGCVGYVVFVLFCD